MRSYSASVRSVAYSWVAMPQHSKHHCLPDSSFQTASNPLARLVLAHVWVPGTAGTVL